MKQGHPPFGVEMKITDDNGKELPWDGKTFGRLKVRGPAVARAYFKDRHAQILDDDGFFDTGDVATIDRYGYMQITDRSKDVIKSGGEWISSIDLENLAVGHPKVAEAAVIGVQHPKWDERPLLIIVLKKDQTATQGGHPRLHGGQDRQMVDAGRRRVRRRRSRTPRPARSRRPTLRERFKDYALPTATGVNSIASRRRPTKCARLAGPCLSRRVTSRTFHDSPDAPAAQIALAEAAAGVSAASCRQPPRPPAGPLHRRRRRVLAAAAARRRAARGHARHLPVLARDRRAALPVGATPRSPARAWNTTAPRPSS